MSSFAVIASFSWQVILCINDVYRYPGMCMKQLKLDREKILLLAICIIACGQYCSPDATHYKLHL